MASPVVVAGLDPGNPDNVARPYHPKRDGRVKPVKPRHDESIVIIEPRLNRPSSCIVRGVFLHAPIEIGKVPIELLEREGEREDPLGVFDR
jgi:hypothetical protein